MKNLSNPGLGPRGALRRPATWLLATLCAATASAALAGASAGFDSNLGSKLMTGDDAGVGLSPLGAFAFNFYGQNYTDVMISNNGFLVLGSQDLGVFDYHPNTAEFLGGAARIAPAWFDMVSAVYVDKQSGSLGVSWVGRQYGGGGEFITQLKLYANGTITFAYDHHMPPTVSVLSGISGGGGAADPGAVNFVGSDFHADGAHAIYALSGAGNFAPDVGVTFTPDGAGGYHVVGGVPPLPGNAAYPGYDGRKGALDFGLTEFSDLPPGDGGGGPGPTSPTPEPATWLLLILGFGLAGGALRRSGRSRASSVPVQAA